MASGGSQLAYTPQPHEQAYFEALFQAADVRRAGAIGGAEAVSFFSTSKLPVEALKSIWTVADQPTSNTLDRSKFNVAVRLIQLLQNGQKGQGADLAAPDGVTLRPVHFEGVSGVSVPVPAQQQMQQPPPQQMQQPPMHPQQHQPPVPMTPPRPYTPSQPQPQRTLAVQDPYTMTPQEQSRYEVLFPQYTRPDGFCYGDQAVALFSKSGVQQAQLAAIWNMVDTPVDNRLDKLEFAMAMHLIVCVSKKNLPLPGGLPPSLKQLKAQVGQPVMAAPSPLPQQQQPQQPVAPPSPGMSLSNRSLAGTPPPTMHMQPPPTAVTTQSMYQQPPSTKSTSLPGPPPLEKPGGMAISDAFEGLNMGRGDASGITESSFGMQPETLSYQQPSVSPKAGSISMPVLDSAPSSPARPIQMETPKTSEQLKQSYNMQSSNEELVKLKAILQKLQAENISLKASMNHLTEEEKDVQKELGAVVAEVGKLSNELTTLRAQVLASKSRLMEASAELKATKEKKGVIQDLIGEAKETKKAIDEAYEGVERANAVLQANPAPAPTPSYENDLFGFGGGEQIPVPAQEAYRAPTPPAVQTVESQASQESYTPSYSVEQQPSYQSYHSEPAIETAPAYQQYTQNSTESPAYYGGNNNPTHQKNLSTSSFGFVMGGDTGALPPEVNMPMYPDTLQEVLSGPSFSMEDISSLKKKLKDAEDVAREAEDSRRAVSAELDESRRLADEAEQSSRQFQSEMEKQNKKKKGKSFMQNRGKKRDPKEGEQLSADANQKKNKVMQVQARLKDAEALANDTRREVERLRSEVESAEIQVASAASMQQPSNDYGSVSHMGNNNTTGSTFDSSPAWFQPNQSAPMTSNFNGDSGYGGFDSSSTGGDGYSVPTPGDTDPYSNPFE